MENSFSRGQDILERYKAQKIKQILKQKLSYSRKIDDYIPLNWDHKKHQLYDFIIHLNYNTSQYKNKENVLEIALSKHDTNVINGLKDINNCVWIVRDAADGSNIYLFKGDESVAFNKVMERKAITIKDIPHIKNGKIDGEISLSIIMKTFYSYDKQYALYLKELFDKTNNQSS